MLLLLLLPLLLYSEANERPGLREERLLNWLTASGATLHPALRIGLAPAPPRLRQQQQQQQQQQQSPQPPLPPPAPWRGMYASAPIGARKLIMSVPFALAMSPASALDPRRSDIARPLRLLRERANVALDDTALLATHLMRERARGATSFWAPYIATLPRGAEEVGSSVLWPPASAAARALRAAGAERAAAAERALLDASFAMLDRHLFKPHAALFTPEHAGCYHAGAAAAQCETRRRAAAAAAYTWASLMRLSRSWLSLDPARPDVTQYLVPGLDLLNHGEGGGRAGALYRRPPVAAAAATAAAAAGVGGAAGAAGTSNATAERVVVADGATGGGARGAAAAGSAGGFASFGTREAVGAGEEVLAVYAGPDSCAADVLLQYGFVPAGLPTQQRRRECFVLELQLRLRGAHGAAVAASARALCAAHHGSVSRERPSPGGSGDGDSGSGGAAVRFEYELRSMRPPPPCLTGVLWLALQEGGAAGGGALAGVLRAIEAPAAAAAAGDAAALRAARRTLQQLLVVLSSAAERRGLLGDDAAADSGVLAAVAEAGDVAAQAAKRALHHARAVLEGARSAFRYNQRWAQEALRAVDQHS
jgi:hypothetical protein